MKALEDAIYTLLAGDATLTGLLADGAAGIYQASAPNNAAVPCLVIGAQAPSVDDHTIGTASVVEQHHYFVKGIVESADGDEPTQSLTIQERIQALMSDAAPAMSSGRVIYCRRFGRVRFYTRDTMKGTTYWHVGGVYEIETAAV